MSLTPNDLANLSPEEKRALLAKLLQQKARGSHAPSPPQQERAGFLDQFLLSVTELASQALLDPAICPDGASAPPLAAPAHILLTGATGFLGAFLLHELLRQTEAQIYCLVRCATAEEGKERIERNLATYALGGDGQSSRIIPVAGDLSQPLLGLSAAQFDALAQRIDTIYHNGAAVNWLSSFTRLKPANVSGTHEVLRLASHIKVKPVHFVSSLSVFPLVGDLQGKIIREEDSLDHGGVLYGGYTQSKWVAEKLVMLARSRGLPVVIYRPGIITGHSQTGAWNTDDFMSRLIKSWIELRSAPDVDGALDMTPVDYVSSAIVHLATSKQSPGKVFHLVNPRRIHIQELVAWIRSAGYPLEHLPYDRWRTELLSRAGRSREQAMYSLLPLFSARTPEKTPRAANGLLKLDEHDTIDRLGSLMAAQYAAQSVKFDDHNTRAGLAGTSIACPPVDGALFERYFSYFLRAGFLHAPDQKEKGELAGQ